MGSVFLLFVTVGESWFSKAYRYASTTCHLRKFGVRREDGRLYCFARTLERLYFIRISFKRSICVIFHLVNMALSFFVRFADAARWLFSTGVEGRPLGKLHCKPRYEADLHKAHSSLNRGLRRSPDRRHVSSATHLSTSHLLRQACRHASTRLLSAPWCLCRNSPCCC